MDWIRDHPFIVEEQRAQGGRRSIELTGWETVVFDLAEEQPMLDALADLGEAIRSAERLIEGWCAVTG